MEPKESAPPPPEMVANYHRWTAEGKAEIAVAERIELDRRSVALRAAVAMYGTVDEHRWPEGIDADLGMVVSVIARQFEHYLKTGERL